MANLSFDGGDVVVRLSPIERVLTWHREVRVPIAELRMVHIEEAPLVGLSPWRFPGLAWPGSFAVGSGHCPSGREFAAAYAGRPAVVLETEGGEWQKVVVSDPDAVAIAAKLAAALLGRGPGGRRDTERRDRRGPLRRRGTDPLARGRSHRALTSGAGLAGRLSLAAACRPADIQRLPSKSARRPPQRGRWDDLAAPLPAPDRVNCPHGC